MFRFSATPQSLGEVLTDALKLYRSTLLRVLPISALIMFISSLPSIIQLITGHSVASLADMHQFMRMPDMLIAAVEIVMTPILIAVLVHAMYSLAQDQGYSWKQSLRVVMSKLPAIFCAFIVSSLLILGGFMLLVFPGIFASIMFLFCIPFVVLDNLGGILALERSWKLVWGHWWSTFVVVLVPLFISIMVMGLMLVIAQQNQLLLVVINIVAMSFLTPLFYSVMLAQFNSLKLQAQVEPPPVEAK